MEKRYKNFNISCPQPDGSRRVSCVKVAALTNSVWPSSVCCSAPISASRSCTVSSPEPDASRRPSCKKATALTELIWPLSVCKQGLQLLSIAGSVAIHHGSSLNSSRIKLQTGLNKKADAYVCSGTISMTLLL